MVLRGQTVRSIKAMAIVVAMMLVTAGCGARLSKAQLAKAAAGGGQNDTDKDCVTAGRGSAIASSENSGDAESNNGKNDGTAAGG